MELKKLLIYISLISFSGMPILNAQNTQNIPIIRGEYLRQKLPGTTSEVFTPGIVSDTSWSKPASASSVIDHLTTHNGCPVYSLDGNTLDQSSQSQDMFIDSGQQLGKSNSWGIALIDLDGDGDLDSYFYNTIWYNDGKGHFQASEKSIGEGDPQFGDFNGDGFIDALVMNQIFINDKNWSFTAHQNLGSGILGSVIADFDNDLDMDVITLYMKTDSLWSNDGTGHFTNTGISFNGWAQSGYAVGDFDQDTDTDIFVTIPHNPPPPPFNPKPDCLFFNIGNNNYKKSTQIFPPITSRNVTTGDIDNDQDLDLLIGNQSSFIQLWLNNGMGRFTQSDQKLSNTSTNEFLIDLDNDNDLDAFIIRGGPMDTGKPNELWLNQNGIFVNSGLKLGKSNSLSAAFGDIDNDGDIDVIIGNIDLKNGGASNKVYINMLIDLNNKY